MTYYSFEDVTIILIDEAGNETEFQLQAPNGARPFVYGYKVAEYVPGLYKDSQQVLQTPFQEFQFFADLGYHSHTMDVEALLFADQIRLRVPLNFTGDTADYTEVLVQLQNRQAVEDWLNGDVIWDPDDIEEGIPKGQMTLQFVGVDPVPWWILAGIGEEFIQADDLSITSLDPDEMAEEGTGDITVAGEGMTASTVFTFMAEGVQAAGITINTTTRNSDEEWVLNVTFDLGSAGTYDVKAVRGDGQESTVVGFNVINP